MDLNAFCVKTIGLYPFSEGLKVLLGLDNIRVFPNPDEFDNELLGIKPGVGDWGSCSWLPAFIFAAI